LYYNSTLNLWFYDIIGVHKLLFPSVLGISLIVRICMLHVMRSFIL